MPLADFHQETNCVPFVSDKIECTVLHATFVWIVHMNNVVKKISILFSSSEPKTHKVSL